MRFSAFGRALALTSAIALATTPALAEKANQLTSLNGLPAEGAESALMSRGFTYVASNTNQMGYTYSYWWDSNDKNCVSVEAYRGSVQTITDASNNDCHHGGDGKAAAAVGVIAGAAILGALLSHKSNHHEDGKHLSSAEAERDYDRGYNDGLHNVAYHNYGDNDAYSSGYQAGVSQRSANLRSHSSRGGYQSYAQIADLKDARAAGGMSELERRGFRQVDNFTSGNTRYSIQYRAASRQCVQVTIADGLFYDIRDIGQHPNCR